MAIEVKAPNEYNSLERYTIFLAGSIDEGRARPWHLEVVKALDPFDILILNPKREEWDASWEQSADNPQFREQVTWEFKAMQNSDMILFVFTEESKAPVSMYEYGRFAHIKDSLICVEEGFYRQGNLDLYSSFDEIPIYHNLDEMIMDLKTVIGKHIGKR